MVDNGAYTPREPGPCHVVQVVGIEKKPGSLRNSPSWMAATSLLSPVWLCVTQTLAGRFCRRLTPERSRETARSAPKHRESRPTGNRRRSVHSGLSLLLSESNPAQGAALTDDITRGVSVPNGSIDSQSASSTWGSLKQVQDRSRVLVINSETTYESVLDLTHFDHLRL